MTEYRLRAVLDYLAKVRGYVTINQVATGVGMSWNTAKNDLEFLTEKGYVITRRGKRFALNYNKKM